MSCSFWMWGLYCFLVGIATGLLIASAFYLQAIRETREFMRECSEQLDAMRRLLGR